MAIDARLNAKYSGYHRPIRATCRDAPAYPVWLWCTWRLHERGRIGYLSTVVSLIALIVVRIRRGYHHMN